MMSYRWTIVVLFVLFLFEIVLGGIQLYCHNEQNEYSLPSTNIVVKVHNLSEYGLFPSKPCAFDHYGKCHSVDHLSIASISSFGCTFTMNNFIVSQDGSIYKGFQHKNRWTTRKENHVVFDNDTISGVNQPEYNPLYTIRWNKAVVKYGGKIWIPFPLKLVDKLVPLRMHWDNCFNHISFQAVPMIGTAFTFYKTLWSKLNFHCSVYTAALINLLGVSMDRIIVARTVIARQVLLPWIPRWMPAQQASIHNISFEVCTLLTKSLIDKKFSPTTLKVIKPLPLTCISHPKASYEELTNPLDPYRYIVYNTRAGQTSRDVYKEKQLLDMVNSMLNKDKYRLVVAGHAHSFKTVELLQASWQRFAFVYSKAVVMMGPHGSASNNVIFTPSDCHCIEFNHFPVHTLKPNATVVRSVAMNAHFAKGGSGKFYNIEPNNVTCETPPDMYFEGWMKISQRQVLMTLQQINADIPTHDLLLPGVNVMNVPDLSVEDLSHATGKTEQELEGSRGKQGQDYVHTV